MKYTLSQRLALARDLRAQGRNCSQCVVGAFADLIGGEESAELLMRAAQGFGSGFGASGNMCGALSGATMILSLVYATEPRPELYRRVREVIDEFRSLKGYVDCRDLKGQGRKPCLELITDTVALLHNRLSDEG